MIDKIAFVADHLPRKCEIVLVAGLQPFVVGVRKACGGRDGVLRNYRELAELGHVSRPGLCQLMKLAQLALAIQEKLLFLPATIRGPHRNCEKQVPFIARVVDWEKRKELFRALELDWEQNAR